MFNLGNTREKSNFTVQPLEKIQRNVKLKDFTSFKIGGTADIYIAPDSIEELKEALLFITQERIPAILLGGGTNLLIPDSGIRGAVIHTCNLKELRLSGAGQDRLVEAAAGVSMQELTEFCAAQGLSGMEDFAGLPGTVGGAVFMNARCYEKSISDAIVSVSELCVSEDGWTLKEHGYHPGEWAYKRSPFQPLDKNHAAITGDRRIIVSAVFKTTPGNADAIRAVMEERIADRREKGHFKLPSAGSVFKNNRAFGKPSGMLIDEAGLRGLRIGGAQVAPWHGNFIVNTGQATAAEVTELIIAVKRRVKEQTGFELEPEIVFAEPPKALRNRAVQTV